MFTAGPKAFRSPTAVADRSGAPPPTPPRESPIEPLRVSLVHPSGAPPPTPPRESPIEPLRVSLVDPSGAPPPTPPLESPIEPLRVSLVDLRFLAHPAAFLRGGRSGSYAGIASRRGSFEPSPRNLLPACSARGPPARDRSSAFLRSRPARAEESMPTSVHRGTNRTRRLRARVKGYL